MLATGGFDHSMAMRWKFQSESLGANLSLGAESNTGDGIRARQELGAAIDLMDQAWWFPAVCAAAAVVSETTAQTIGPTDRLGRLRKTSPQGRAASSEAETGVATATKELRKESA